ncbi:MAG TPA: histidine phosphatase family protein [Alphaproteobacteria bacterium]|nr:histidine phosphatase family protein [Alphaproteobacteria bacterium]
MATVTVLLALERFSAQDRCVAATKLKQNKQLVLLRHAKSSWDDPFIEDFDRPLAKRGRKAAARLATWLKQHRVRPDLILCSPAVRTRETLALIVDALGEKADIAYDKALYLAEADALLAKIQAADNAAACVMLIGHNPGMHELALSLLKPGAKGDRGRLEEKFPTAAIARFKVPVAHWADLQPGEAALVDFIKPADLDD